jgi:hypothetical protein
MSLPRKVEIQGQDGNVVLLILAKPDGTFAYYGDLEQGLALFNAFVASQQAQPAGAQ